MTVLAVLGVSLFALCWLVVGTAWGRNLAAQILFRMFGGEGR